MANEAKDLQLNMETVYKVKAFMDSLKDNNIAVIGNQQVDITVEEAQGAIQNIIDYSQALKERENIAQTLTKDDLQEIVNNAINAGYQLRQQESIIYKLRIKAKDFVQDLKEGITAGKDLIKDTIQNVQQAMDNGVNSIKDACERGLARVKEAANKTQQEAQRSIAAAKTEIQLAGTKSVSSINQVMIGFEHLNQKLEKSTHDRQHRDIEGLEEIFNQGVNGVNEIKNRAHLAARSAKNIFRALAGKKLDHSENTQTLDIPNPFTKIKNRLNELSTEVIEQSKSREATREAKQETLDRRIDTLEERLQSLTSPMQIQSLAQALQNTKENVLGRAENQISQDNILSTLPQRPSQTKTADMAKGIVDKGLEAGKSFNEAR